MLEALKDIPVSIKVQLVLIGKFSSPRVERKFREMVEVDRLGGRVHYMGYLPHEETVMHLMDADIGLFLANGRERYKWGELIKYFEYSLCGLPIVMSDLPAKRALIEKNGNGVLVSPDSANVAANAVIYLIEDPRQARLMGERGRRAFLERYNWELIETRLFNLHDGLLCRAHPKVAPGRIVQTFKSITARETFRRKPTVKKELWGGEFWTDGYYVVMVGERANWDTVEKYVQRQAQPKAELKQLRLFD